MSHLHSRAGEQIKGLVTVSLLNLGIKIFTALGNAMVADLQIKSQTTALGRPSAAEQRNLPL